MFGPVIDYFVFVSTIDVEKTVIPVLIATVSSGFIFGLVKVLPERRSILVQASENAVKVVNDAISTLQKELSEARGEIMKLEAELRLTKENRQALEDQVDALKYKVAKMEAELQVYARLAGEHLTEPDRDRLDDAATKVRKSYDR